jgi:hypothetical protein
MNVRVLLPGVLFLTIPALAQVAMSRANLQTVIGFEDQTSTALPGWYANPPGTVSADDQAAHSGHWSVRMERNARSPSTTSYITRMLPINFHGGVIELRGFLRLQDVSDFAGLWMREDAHGQMLAFENMRSQKVNGSREWAEYHITLPVDAKAEELYFGVVLSGTGTLWVDDLQLLVDGKPIAQPMQPSMPVDHEFDKGSGIQMTVLTAVKIENLVTLGRVWGFLKYHHPAITAGRRDWDYDLFRVLPDVLAAPDRARANDAILHWIDVLGPVPACRPCVPAPARDLPLEPPLDWIHDRSELGTLLSERLEKIYANRSGHQFYVSQAWAGSNPTFDHEAAYSQVAFPDFGYQLLALFRWWNIMQYWAPDRDVAGQVWPAVLKDLIPKVALAKDKRSYVLALFEMVATANDTHANLWGSLAERPPVGVCAVPAVLRFIGNKPVVYRTIANNGRLQPGDVLERLGDQPIPQLVDDWSKYYADSNEAARQRDLARYLTRGVCGPVAVDLERAGTPLHIFAQRVHVAPERVITHDKPGDTFRLLSPSVGYVKLSSIKASDLASYVIVLTDRLSIPLFASP